MLYNSSARHRLSKSAIFPQVLAVAISAGCHYLLVNNLGLFARFDPPKIRPLSGGVKVVELTPAEQTRVPAAAKSAPLPISPTPIDPATATRQPFNPFGQNSPLPPTRPARATRILPTTPDKSIPPRSDRSNSPVKPPINPQIKVIPPAKQSLPTTSPSKPDSSPSLDDSGAPPANDRAGAGKSPSPSTGSTPNSGKTSPSLDDPNSDRRTPPTSTASSSPPKTPAAQPPIKKSPNELRQVQLNFDKQVQSLRSKYPGVVEKQPETLPVRAYPRINNCSNQRNGYVSVGVLLDDQGTPLDLPLLSTSTELEPKNVGVGENPQELNRVSALFIQSSLQEADEMAKKRYEARSAAQKVAEQGKKVFYTFIFEYDAKSCPS
jgi:hypothetical protein